MCLFLVLFLLAPLFMILVKSVQDRDGTFVGLEGKAVTGRDNLVKFIQARNAKPSVQTRTHWASNIIIRPSANGATAESYQMTVDQGGETFRVSGTHIKVDELRRENGKWRFYHRRSVPMARK